MAETTLAVADVVEMLNQGGWLLTGGADKVRAGSPAEEHLPLNRAFQNMMSGVSLIFRLPDNKDEVFGYDSDVRFEYRDSNTGVINLRGRRPILQTRRKSEGGGSYEIGREVQLLTLTNPNLAMMFAKQEAQRVAAKIRAARQDFVDQLTHLFRAVETITPEGDPRLHEYTVGVSGGRTCKLFARPVPNEDGKFILEIDLN